MITYLFLIISLMLAVLDWLAIYKKWRVLEYICKPAALIFLIIWFFQQNGFSGPSFWFGVGLIFSLLGDVLLLFSYERIIPGLIAFLLAHIAYIICFAPGTWETAIYPLLIALAVGITTFFVLRAIAGVLKRKDKSKELYAIILYGAVISIMLFLAATTSFREGWMVKPAILIGIGAALFFLSDILLAWNKYVNPFKYGRLMNMPAYHMGQIMLAIGMVIQFS